MDSRSGAFPHKDGKCSTSPLSTPCLAVGPHPIRTQSQVPSPGAGGPPLKRRQALVGN